MWLKVVEDKLCVELLSSKVLILRGGGTLCFSWKALVIWMVFEQKGFVLRSANRLYLRSTP